MQYYVKVSFEIKPASLQSLALGRQILSLIVLEQQAECSKTVVLVAAGVIPDEIRSLVPSNDVKQFGGKIGQTIVVDNMNVKFKDRLPLAAVFHFRPPLWIILVKKSDGCYGILLVFVVVVKVLKIGKYFIHGISYQSENSSDLHNFKWQLRKSMSCLIDIMENLKLTPVGCELELPQKEGDLKLDKIGAFGARIDFLLEDEQGMYVVFDFKWSNSNKYEGKLENNSALQLELYKQAVKATYPDKDVAGVGYYLMPQMQLLTTDFRPIPNSTIIRHIDQKAEGIDNMYERIKNSYSYRMKEIGVGHIEEAETMDLKDETSGYYYEEEDKYLYPLEMDTVTKGKGQDKVVESISKCSEKVYLRSNKKSYDSKDKEFYEIPTSHPILKGRLK